MDFFISTEYRDKIKEKEKRGKYLDIAWEQRKL